MGSKGVQAVMVREAGVSSEDTQQFHALGRAVRHRGRDRVIQPDHGIVRQSNEQIAERQDLRPIGVAGSTRFIRERRRWQPALMGTLGESSRNASGNEAIGEGIQGNSLKLKGICRGPGSELPLFATQGMPDDGM